MEIPYKHYHLEIIATNDQEANLKKKLLAGGLAIDIKPFDLTKYQKADELQASDIQNFLQSHYESAGMQRYNYVKCLCENIFTTKIFLQRKFPDLRYNIYNYCLYLIPRIYSMSVVVHS